MEFSWLAAVRAVHVVAAAVWFGATAFAILFLGPTIRAAGPEARGFVGVVQRRGGFGRFMGPAAATTLASGAVLFWRYDYLEAPFASLSSTLLTTGAALALGGWAFGLAAALPAQRKLAAVAARVGPGGPTPEQASAMQGLQATMMRRGRWVGVAVAIAFLLMVGRNVVA